MVYPAHVPVTDSTKRIDMLACTYVNAIKKPIIIIGVSKLVVLFEKHHLLRFISRPCFVLYGAPWCECVILMVTMGCHV